MLDLGWSELLIIGVVALIVVGPKDLPRMLRTLGQYAARARGMAREFQRSMDEAARQADIDELKDVKKGLDDMRQAQYKMQRDMSQSFLDSPAKKTPAAKQGDGEAKAEAKPEPTAAEATKADPAPASSTAPAPASAPAPAEESAKTAAPGKAAGA